MIGQSDSLMGAGEFPFISARRSIEAALSAGLLRFLGAAPSLRLTAVVVLHMRLTA